MLLPVAGKSKNLNVPYQPDHNYDIGSRLERDLDGSGSETPRESRGGTRSAGRKTNGGEDGIGRAGPPDPLVAPSISKAQESPQDKAEPPPVKRGKDTQAKVKRKRGRPRIETDEAER